MNSMKLSQDSVCNTFRGFDQYFMHMPRYPGQESSDYLFFS
jgi:hypothetical protein